MSIYENPELTPREHMLLENENNERRLAREHAVTIKQLELEMLRDKNQAAIELKKLEAKWSSWLRLPSLIIKLPVLVVLAFGYIVSSVRGEDPTKDFWNYMR